MSASGTKRTNSNAAAMSANDQSGLFSVLVMELGRVFAVGKLDSNARYRQTDSQTKDRRFDRLQ